MAWRAPATGAPATAPEDGYKWVALSNTTAGVFMSALDGSIGVFFSLLIAGLASSLPHTLTTGLEQQHVPPAVAAHVGSLPPVASLFAAVLGENPVEHLLQPDGTLATLPPSSQATLTGTTFFPHLLAGPFHDGLVVVFSVAAILSVLGAAASLLRGGRYVPRS